MITFKKKIKNTRNCGGTHKLQNKTNRKIATCENFSKKVKFFQKTPKTKKICIVEKNFHESKVFFSNFYYCVPNFRALGLIMNDFFFY